jgi:hypothetical protein
MKKLIFILSMFLASNIYAAKPQEATCSILVDNPVYTGTKYLVKIVRVPSYPGAWRNPTFYVDVTYEDETVQNEVREVSTFNITYQNFYFNAPSKDSGATTNGVGSIVLAATILEPLKGNKVKVTRCMTTTTLTNAN